MLTNFDPRLFCDLEVVEEFSVLSGEEGDCLSRLSSSASTPNPARQSLDPQHLRDFSQFLRNNLAFL